MDVKQVAQDTNYSHRTQISLSPLMRQMVDQARGEKSLSEYVRISLLERLQKEFGDAHFLNKLAQKVTTPPVGKKVRTVKEVLKWQREMRQDDV